MSLRIASSSRLEKIFDQITDIAFQIHQSSDLTNLLTTAVRESRSILECDRALIYQFLPQGDGVVAAESVGTGWTAILGQLIYDPCFNSQWIETYQQGRISAIEDIYNSSVQPCYIELLERFQVQANLVVPILIRQRASPQLWGLLIAHQCDRLRQWQKLEIKLLQNIAMQISIGVQYNQLRQQQIKRSKLADSPNLEMVLK